MSRAASGGAQVATAVRERLSGLRAQWLPADPASAGAATARELELLAGLEAFFAGDFGGAAVALQVSVEVESATWLAYFRHAAAALRVGAPAAEVGAALAALNGMQPVLGGTAALQDVRWRALRRLPGYSLDTARDALERVIHGAVGTPLAAEAREELGALLGLTGEHALLLRTAKELDDAFSDYVTSRDETELDSALGMLSLPDSTYVLTAVVGLTILRQSDPPLAAALSQRRAAAAGRTRERLDAILATSPPAPRQPSAPADAGPPNRQQ